MGHAKEKELGRKNLSKRFSLLPFHVLALPSALGISLSARGTPGLVRALEISHTPTCLSGRVFNTRTQALCPLPGMSFPGDLAMEESAGLRPQFFPPGTGARTEGSADPSSAGENGVRGNERGTQKRSNHPEHVQ